MNKTLLESQEGVLYFTSLALSMISAISSVASHSVQNPQTLQRFLSPLYSKLAHLMCSKCQMHVQSQEALDGPMESVDAEYRLLASTVGQAAKHGQCMV